MKIVKLFSPKTKDIQHILRFYFLSLSITLLGLVSVVFAVLQYRSYKESALESLSRTSLSVAESIESNLTQLDSIVLNTICSDLPKEILRYSDPSKSEYERLQIRKELSSLLLSHKGFDYTVRQLNIYTLSGTGYCLGDYTGADESAAAEERFTKSLERNGRKYLSVVSFEGRNYLSLCRSYFDSYHNPAGIVEGRKYFEDFFSAALKTDFQYNARVLIYNSLGEMIACNREENGNMFPYCSCRDTGTVRLRNTGSKEEEYAVYNSVGSNDFTVVMTVRVSELMNPLRSSLSVTVALILAVFLLGFILSSFMAKRLSTPIRNIYHFLSNKDTMYSSPLDVRPSGVREIDRLTESINEYVSRSKEQTETIISLNEQEIRAQMLALQSQMNPHFLYNSLSSISEMSREGMNGAVIAMTSNISEILRYLSSNRDKVIPAGTELDICDRYLECMKIRFGEDLKYHFEIEDGIWEQTIPKLSVQLLIENAIKAVTKLPPPWEILIKGVTNEEEWHIEVLDNGPGFDEGQITSLQEKMNNIASTGNLPELEINGSGLLNIFIRFYLIYGIPFIFDFGNRANRGAYVKIGVAGNGHLQNLSK